MNEKMNVSRPPEVFTTIKPQGDMGMLSGTGIVIMHQNIMPDMTVHAIANPFRVWSAYPEKRHFQYNLLAHPNAAVFPTLAIPLITER